MENISDEDDIPDNIVLGLPNLRTDLSDEDSGDEICTDPNRLNPVILQTVAEVFFDSLESEEGCYEEVIESTVQPTGNEGVVFEGVVETADQSRDILLNEVEMDESDQNSFENLIKDYLDYKQYKPSWIVGNERDTRLLMQTESDRFLPPLTLSMMSEPIDFFKLFVSDNLIDHIVRETNKYAGQKNKNLQVTKEEIYVVLGVLILSGYCSVPRRRMYWEQRQDTNNTLITRSISRNRFEEIFNSLHFTDNDTIDLTDKMAKLRPLLNILNENFLRYSTMEKDLSIDESMIPYFGRNSCKQFIANKPVRFGYKAWVISQKLGYCLQLDIYQGASNQKSKLGLGESVVLKFAHVLQTNYPDFTFDLYFDNFFSNFHLILYLRNMGFGGTGTIRDNRIKNSALTDLKTMKKQTRGSFMSTVEKKAKVIMTRWCDNNVVTLISNKYGENPIGKAKRYSRKEKKRVDIDQPYSVKMYNRNMGGVDQTDNNVSNYRINIRGKRYYFPIFMWLIDVCVSNAWILSRSFGLNLDNLEFRRKIVENLLATYGKNGNTQRLSAPAIISARPGPHIIITQQNRLRCKVCKNKTTKSCKTCGVALHDKCFEEFHKT